MKSWETCQIEEVTLRDFEIKGGLFGDRYIPGIYRWEAKIVDSSGAHTIYQSEEFQFGSSSLGSSRPIYEKEWENRELAYQKLIAHLSGEGWEPAATNQGGTITLMKRQIKEPKSQLTTESTDLIQQLANLRDAGILTEQEFQAKKAEILKRI